MLILPPEHPLLHPGSPLPAFSRFMVEAAGTGVAAARSRGDASGSSVAGVGAGCQFSSRRSPAVSRRACVHQRKQEGELRCSGHAHCGGHGSWHVPRLGRRSEPGGGHSEQQDPGKPSLRGISVSGSCRDELIVVLLVLPMNNSFPLRGHAVILNIIYFSLYGLKKKTLACTWG